MMEKSKKRQLRRSLSNFVKQPKRLETLKEYVENGGDVNVVHKSTTVLCEASRHGNIEAVGYLLEHGANPDLCDSAQCSPLYLAASHGQYSILERLVKAGADLDKRNQNGYTALVSAVQNGQDKCAFYLIGAGAEVNISRPNTFGVDISLLSYVLFAKGDTEMAEKLLEAGTMPEKFTPPLGFILLEQVEEVEDSEFPLGYVQHLVSAGFDVYCDGWVDMMKRRGDREISASQRKLVELLDHEHRNAPSLQRLTRVALRTALIHSGTRSHMLKKIEALPLPVEIKKYVALKYL